MGVSGSPGSAGPVGLSQAAIRKAASKLSEIHKIRNCFSMMVLRSSDGPLSVAWWPQHVPVIQYRLQAPHSRNRPRLEYGTQEEPASFDGGVPTFQVTPTRHKRFPATRLTVKLRDRVPA